MLSFTGNLKVWVDLDPTDMRKSYEGLAALVAHSFKLDVKSGALFVFTNRKRNRLKILYWDGSGLWVLSKRLEQGCFSWPQPSEANQLTLALRPEAFAMLTDGVDLRGAKLRPWYERQ
jgi:transposase